MNTFTDWLALICCLALAANSLACGHVAWKDSRGTHDKVFSVIFYVLGAAMLAVAVYGVRVEGF